MLGGIFRQRRRDASSSRPATKAASGIAKGTDHHGAWRRPRARHAASRWTPMATAPTGSRAAGADSRAPTYERRNQTQGGTLALARKCARPSRFAGSPSKGGRRRDRRAEPPFTFAKVTDATRSAGCPIRYGRR